MESSTQNLAMVMLVLLVLHLMYLELKELDWEGSCKNWARFGLA